MESYPEQNDRNIPFSYDYVDKYPDFPVLAASSTAGCSICGAIHEGIRDHLSNLRRPPAEDWDKMVRFCGGVIRKEVFNRPAMTRNDNGIFNFVFSYNLTAWRHVDFHINVFADEGKSRKVLFERI